MSTVSTLMEKGHTLPMDAEGCLSFPLFLEGGLRRGTFNALAAFVIQNGGEFTYRTKKKGWFKTVYYDVKFKGTKVVLLKVAQWLDDNQR